MSAAIAFVSAWSRDERREVLRLLHEAAELPEPETLARAAHDDQHGGDGWMDAKAAAQYLGMTIDALHKLTGPRLIPFHQEAPGCKLWFKRSELDDWREGGGSRFWR